MNKVRKGEPRRIRITGIHRSDATYQHREDFIGKIGTFTPDLYGIGEPGYFAGEIEYDDQSFNGCAYFHAIRYRRI